MTLLSEITVGEDESDYRFLNRNKLRMAHTLRSGPTPVKHNFFARAVAEDMTTEPRSGKFPARADRRGV